MVYTTRHSGGSRRGSRGRNGFEHDLHRLGVVQKLRYQGQLFASLDPVGRDHELLARRVRNNVESHGILNTPTADLVFVNATGLIVEYNGHLYDATRPVSRRSTPPPRFSGHIMP